MVIVVKSSDESTISLPAQLMEKLGLCEGDEVKATFDGQTLRLTRLQNFLNLRGALADDEAFDRAMELIEQAWQSWAIPKSV